MKTNILSAYKESHKHLPANNKFFELLEKYKGKEIDFNGRREFLLEWNKWVGQKNNSCHHLHLGDLCFDMTNPEFREELSILIDKGKNWNFSYLNFPNVYFRNSSFLQKVVFSKAKFLQEAHFSGTTFEENADFLGTSFLSEADFSDLTSLKELNFSLSTFAGEVTFYDLAIKKGARLLSYCQIRIIYWNMMLQLEEMVIRIQKIIVNQ